MHRGCPYCPQLGASAGVVSSVHCYVSIFPGRWRHATRSHWQRTAFHWQRCRHWVSYRDQSLSVSQGGFYCACRVSRSVVSVASVASVASVVVSQRSVKSGQWRMVASDRSDRLAWDASIERTATTTANTHVAGPRASPLRPNTDRSPEVRARHSPRREKGKRKGKRKGKGKEKGKLTTYRSAPAARALGG